MAYDHSQAMGKIDHPCLVLSNDGDSIHHIAARCCEMFPHFDWFEMEGGTFDIIDEQPEAWVDSVDRWLSKPN
ncbi:MAG: hypothetical protein VYA80_03625 [Pseudomonadota bacterium]|nr:hypothetical protein [Pseudomonadota bacterium]